MQINFEFKTKTLWHRDCKQLGGGSPMRELKDEGDMTLLECTKCSKKGYYPHGRSGVVEVQEITT